MNKGKLYIVATPIGNLEDISLRALNTLRQADIILAEDTRTASKLLNRHEIKNKLQAFNQHSSDKQEQQVLDNLKQEKQIALISEAGTPGISDPGSKLVSRVRQEQVADIIAIPGPAAVSTLVSIAGLGVDKFLFLGFLPHKKGRLTALKEIAQSKVAVVLYESKHRLLKLLTELTEHNLSDRELIIGRELTKLYETIYCDTVINLLQYFIEHPQEVKGEFSLIIKKSHLK